MRDGKIGGVVFEVKQEAADIIEQLPPELKQGIRTMFLLQRTKDGGHNKEEKRIFRYAVTYDDADLLTNLTDMLFLRYLHGEDLRIYLSVNERNERIAVRNIHDAIIESLYVDTTNRDLIQRKVLKGSRAYMMNPNARASKNFLIDVDSQPDVDVMGEVLQEMGELGIEELYRKSTRNGWHIIVKPFNLALWKGPAEIKRDGLILLK